MGSRSVQTMSYLGYRSPGGEEKSLCFSLPVIKTSHFLHLLLLLLLSLLLLPPGVLLLVSSPPSLSPLSLLLPSSPLLRPTWLVGGKIRASVPARRLLHPSSCLHPSSTWSCRCGCAVQGWSPRGSSQWCEDPDQGIQEQLYGKPGAKSFTEKHALLWGRVIHRLGGLPMGPRTGESKSATLLLQVSI